MSKTQAMFFLLIAEDEAKKNGNIEIALDIRADYILLVNGFYDEILD
jgi:hypothetical protein